MVFDEISKLGFKTNKSLKDHLVHSVLPVPDKEGRQREKNDKERSFTMKIIFKRRIISKTSLGKETTKTDTKHFLSSCIPGWKEILKDLHILVTSDNSYPRLVKAWKNIQFTLYFQCQKRKGDPRNTMGIMMSICNLIRETSTFSHNSTNKTFETIKRALIWDSKYVICLISFASHFQYTLSKC